MNETSSTCPEAPPLFPDWVRVIGLCLFVFSTVYIPTTLLLWFMRRQKFMLKKRSFRLVLISSIGVYLNVFTGSWVNWVGSSNFPCHAHAFTVFMVLPLAAGPVVVRLVLFYNKHRYAKLVYEERKRNEKISPGRFKKNNLASSVLALLGYTFDLSKGNQQPASTASVAVTEAEDVATTVFSEVEGSARPEEEIQGEEESSALFALHCMSSKFSYSFALLSLFIVIGFVSILMQYMPEDSPYRHGCSACALDNGDLVYLCIVLVLVIFPGAYVLYKLRGVEDPLGIKQELLYTMVLGLLVLFFMGVALADPFGLRREYKFEWMYLVNISALVYHSVQCVWPIIRSYERPMEETDVKLSEVLTSNRQRLRFAKYLAIEFSVENLWFYDAVLQYREYYNNLTEGKKMELAQEIYHTFIRDGSLLQVNLSSKTGIAIGEALAAAQKSGSPPERSVFDKGQEQIYKLMEEDSFPRFLKSKFYKTGKKAIEPLV